MNRGYSPVDTQQEQSHTSRKTLRQNEMLLDSLLVQFAQDPSLSPRILSLLNIQESLVHHSDPSTTLRHSQVLQGYRLEFEKLNSVHNRNILLGTPATALRGDGYYQNESNRLQATHIEIDNVLNNAMHARSDISDQSSRLYSTSSRLENITSKSLDL